MSQLLLQREFPLTVVGTFTQHKGLYDATQGVSGKLRVGNEHGILGLIATVNRRQFMSIPAFW